MIRLIAVNAGRAERIGTKSGRTGHFKRPVSGPALIGTLGLEGDTVVDTRHHGGPDQAIYLFGQGDLAFWSEALARPLGPGAFGENLTLEGLDTADMAIGDRLVLGDVVLELTAPRIPCATLAAVMGDPGFVARFRAARRCGGYARVIAGGPVAAGQVAEHRPFAGQRLNLCEMFDLAPERMTSARRDALLASPLHFKARRDLEAQLA